MCLIFTLPPDTKTSGSHPQPMLRSGCWDGKAERPWGTRRGGGTRRRASCCRSACSRSAASWRASCCFNWRLKACGGAGQQVLNGPQWLRRGPQGFKVEPLCGNTLKMQIRPHKLSLTVGSAPELTLGGGLRPSGHMATWSLASQSPRPLLGIEHPLSKGMGLPHFFCIKRSE